MTHSGSLSLTLTAEKACYETASPPAITIANNTPYNAKAIELTPVPEPQGRERFSLTPPGGPAYTLTIKDCVRTIAAGEFTPTPARVTDPSDATRTITGVTKLAGLLGSSGQNEKVTAIILPESLISIGDIAFYGHRRVNGELIIPASVERIGKAAFTELGAFYIATASGSGGVKVTFAPNSKLREIKVDAFRNSIIDAVSELPATLETIGRSAFYSGSLGIQSTNFIIPANIKSIGFAAFGNQNPRVSGKLTIKSPKLTRTPGDTTQTKTGRLQNKLFRFTPGVAGTEANPFTTIALHEAVFNSYTQPDLEAIFDTGGQYVDIQDETRVLTK